MFTFESTEILSIKVLGNETKWTGFRDMSRTDIREDLDVNIYDMFKFQSMART